MERLAGEYRTRVEVAPPASQLIFRLQGPDKQKGTKMANKVESIASTLGELRKQLVDQGYNEDQAFWLVQDLIRRSDSVFDMVDLD